MNRWHEIVVMVGHKWGLASSPHVHIHVTISTHRNLCTHNTHDYYFYKWSYLLMRIYQCCHICFQLTYKMDKVQLNFLQLLSSEASQQLTVGCYNTISYFGNGNSTSQQAVKFLTSDDKELSPHGSSKFTYDVISDSCQVSYF